MAATMKHRRSSQKRDHTRGADRYDKKLKRSKKIKKYGGSFLVKSKVTGKLVPGHIASKDNPIYNGVKVVSDKKD